MNLETLLGLSGISLLLSVILMKILLLLGLNRQTAYSAAILFFALSFIPISGYSVNYYVRGLLNDLSISTWVLMGYFLLNPGSNKLQSRPLLTLIAITGLFFYPAALGLGPVDPYAWGYLNKAHGLLASLAFLSILAGLMYFALRKHYTMILICLVCSMLAYQFEVLESRNLWDYLFDPVVFFYALIQTLRISTWKEQPEK